MITEERILDGCLSGRREFQKLLYERYSAKMFAVCLRYCRNREEAEDVLQDGFVRVFTSIGTFRRDGSLEGWVRRIIVNTALMYLREKKKEPFSTDIDSLNGYSLYSYSDTASQLNAKELLKMLDRLPDGYRLVFNLFAVEGYSHKEIAAQLGITEGTSKSQLSKARAHLQEMLNKISIEELKEYPAQ